MPFSIAWVSRNIIDGIVPVDKHVKGGLCVLMVDEDAKSMVQYRESGSL